MARVATIGAHLPFLDTIARRWLAQAGPDPLDAASGLILLPTRRAARGLRDAFLRATGGEPLLLPRIAAIGAPDEDFLNLAGSLVLPPPISAPRRLALLTRLILARHGEGGAPRTADRAWPLAASLAQLLDEAARAEISLRDALPNLASGEFASHWEQITRFLAIITEHWPRVLADERAGDIAERQVELLRAQSARWRQAPPETPVWAAGSTGGIGAVASLLGVVANLPKGQVILPGLDLDMDEPAWDAIEPGHPQSSLRELLNRMGTLRAEVADWTGSDQTVPVSRTRALNLALCPAGFIPDWRESPPQPLGDMTLLEPSDQQSEAVAIALALRQGLDQPNRRVALITRDRGLAARVAAELLRFGVVADDSAGEPLAATPPAVFLRLLVEACRTALAPVALLALLKHPLAAFGLAPAACREAARRLEKRALRGPAPQPGIAGLRGRLREPDHFPLLDRLEAILTPLATLLAQPAVAPALFLDRLIESAEQAAGTPDASGPSILWAQEEGEALAEALAELRPAFAVLPDQDPSTLPGLFAAALEGQVVRSRRALRGRADRAEHPRVFIWGLLEARLQSADLAVLGGLAEGVWPPAADSGPWMNRTMRQQAGLPSPEERIEQAAHDFVMAACCAPSVILSAPKRRDNAPAVPARWLTRLRALLAGWGMTLPTHPAQNWALELDRAQTLLRRERPEPRPPVDSRPRQLSVSDVELWLNDPYGLYAKRILRLRRLDALEQNADQADFGNLVHAALAAFFTEAADDWPQDAARRLEARLHEEFAKASLRPAILAWWRPRLTRIARWVDETETARRAGCNITARKFEAEGELALGDGFALRARADRIERLGESAYAIIDYKTGVAPAQSRVENGFAPQLPLEGMMTEWGGFGADLQGEVHELAYWKLSGVGAQDKEISLWRSRKQDQRAKTEEATSNARAALLGLIRDYQDPDQPYLSAPDPRRDTRYSDYTILARRCEWSAAEDEAEETEG